MSYSILVHCLFSPHAQHWVFRDLYSTMKKFYTILASNNMLVGHMHLKSVLWCSLEEARNVYIVWGGSFSTALCKCPFPGSLVLPLYLPLSSPIISSLQWGRVPRGQDQAPFILCPLCLAWQLTHRGHSPTVYSPGRCKNDLSSHLSNREGNIMSL